MSRRRQVLQLEDVSSSHPTKTAGFQVPQIADKTEKVNPLLSLVGQYNSDSSSEEEDDSADGYVNGGQHDDEPHPKTDNDATPIDTLPDSGMSLPAELPSKEPVANQPKLSTQSNLPAPESVNKLPVPEPTLIEAKSADGVNNSIDSEVANFLAEIESISAESVGQVEDTNTASPTPASLAPSALSPTPSYGFIPKANAAISASQEEDIRLKAAPTSGTSTATGAANPYTAMFVKGALEFVGKDKEGEGKVESGLAQDEDLPEEPLCDWQMVQDDSTQYYYYWNIRTNEVTWEIPPSYTQFLLLYKEYEERLACIPLEKQLKIKEKKRLELEERREPSPAPSSSDPHSSAGRRHKHRKDKSQRAGPPDVPIGPHLPSELPETHVISSGQAESGMGCDLSPLPEPASPAAVIKVTSGEEILASSEFAVDSTSMVVSADIEAIFDEALFTIAAHSSDKKKEASPSTENFGESAVVAESSAAVTSSKRKKLKKQGKDDKKSKDGDERDVKKTKDRDTIEDKKSIDRDYREDRKLKDKDIREDKKSRDKTQKSRDRDDREDKKQRDRDEREDKKSKDKEDRGDKKSRDRDKEDKKPRARDDREDKKPRDREDKKLRDRDDREDKKLRDRDDREDKKQRDRDDRETKKPRDRDSRETKKPRDKDDKEEKKSWVSREDKKPRDKNDREDKKKQDKDLKSRKQKSLGVVQETDSLKPSSSVELHNLARAPSVEKGVDTAQSAITTTSIVTTTAFTVATQKNAIVSSSSSSSTVTSVEGELFNGNDAVVSNSGMNDETGEDEEFDVDFDDIDDVDRALEKALEKKLEKKKAELERLQREDTEDMEFDSFARASSSPRSPSRPEMEAVFSKSGSAVAKDNSHRSAFSAPDTAVSSSMRSIPPSTLSSLKVSNKPAGEPEMSDMHIGSSKSKRLAVETSSNGMERQAQPVTKKARLVAYDTPETDEDSLDTSDEVSTSCVKLPLPASDDSSFKSQSTVSTEKVHKLDEIQDMADTALAKLTFLDVTSEGLSSLQLTLIQLQTRLLDWKEGGLNSEYFYQRLREVNAVLRQYESSAVPSGWTCQWDSNFRRYFYANASTGQAQWDYPDGDPSAVAASTSTIATATTMLADSSNKASTSAASLTKAKKKRVKVVPGAEQFLSAKGEIKPSGDGEMETEQTSTYWNIQEKLDGDIIGADRSHRYKTSKVHKAKPSGEEVTIATTSVPGAPLNTSFVASTEPGSCEPSSCGAFQTLFPGEPLPPGTEFLLGLPPPPPPPLPPPPPDETPSTTNDVYACGDDSSEGEAAEAMAVAATAMYDPDIDGEEMRDETDERHRWPDSEVDGVPIEVEEVPPVISKPPHLHAPGQAVSSAHVPTVPYATHVYEAMSSSVSISKPAMLSAVPVLNVTGLASHVPDSVSSAASALHAAATVASVYAAATVAPSIHAAAVSASSGVAPSLYSTSNPGSPKEDKTRRAGSPVPYADVPSSSTGDQHKGERPKKKKEKLGSHTMSLKKKGVASMVQKWQKVKKEVEREERASEQRQMAIRQQLEEWKKENS